MVPALHDAELRACDEALQEGCPDLDGLYVLAAHPDGEARAQRDALQGEGPRQPLQGEVADPTVGAVLPRVRLPRLLALQRLGPHLPREVLGLPAVEALGRDRGWRAQVVGLAQLRGRAGVHVGGVRGDRGARDHAVGQHPGGCKGVGATGGVPGDAKPRQPQLVCELGQIPRESGVAVAEGWRRGGAVARAVDGDEPHAGADLRQRLLAEPREAAGAHAVEGKDWHALALLMVGQ
mmetsp:Transcript_84307/g.272907  ORF Transcript_84307/g.272907 Transcript_84307/m.272907 type:complete len:236 (-) Transcript_84307:79-786(-)